MGIRFYISSLFSFCSFICCLAQVDSLYIVPYDQKLSVRGYFGKDFVFLMHEDGDHDKEYFPNNPVTIGAGFSLKNFAFGFSYGYGFDFMRAKEYGKTESLNFQLHNYGRRYAIDLFVQDYKGFYWEDDKNNIELFPDMSVRQYGLHGQYIFNGNKFSYKAAFDQSEIQLRSAGSFLLGGGVYLTHIETGGDVLVEGKNVFDNFQFGVGAGYAYTWVISPNWFVSGSVVTGINFGNEAIGQFGRQRLEVYPTVFPRIAAGFTKADWAIGFTYVNNFIFPSFTENGQLGISSGGAHFSFIKRFDLIPFLDKK